MSIIIKEIDNDYYGKSNLIFKDNLIKKLEIENIYKQNFINNSLKNESKKCHDKDQFIEKNVIEKELQEKTCEASDTLRRQDVLIT